MKVRLLRHATTIVEFAGKKILVDPVLSPAGVKNSIPTKRSGKGLRNPLVDIPIEKTDLELILFGQSVIMGVYTGEEKWE